MYVNAGELNQRIEIVRRVRETDADGFEATREEVVRTAYARFSQVSGTEIIRAGADFGRVNVRFLIRWAKTPIDRKMFVRYRGESYEIEYVNNYGDSGQYTELWCVKEEIGG